jgi:hypothetical protein
MYMLLFGSALGCIMYIYDYGFQVIHKASNLRGWRGKIIARS